MATHSSVLAWTIPGMGEPGGLWTEYHKLRGYKKSEMLNGNEYKMVIRKQTNILLNPVKTVPSSG